MYISKNINTEHKDLVHDVAFDFYGKRMATCSSDQNVKIWDQNEKGEWICTNVLKSHNGSVWKVTWGHPEFGQILATCSFDRTAVLWEETVTESPQGLQSTWYRRSRLVDSKSLVTDVKFAPKSMGLILATCSDDGMVRIYEATDVMNINHWSLIHEIQTKLNSCSCLSWNPSLSRLHSPLIAVGSDDPGTDANGKVLIFELLENSRKWVKIESITSINEPVHDIAFAPNMGRSYHLLAVASKNVKILTLKPTTKSELNQSSSLEVRQAASFDNHGPTAWRVSWNITGTILASSGDDGCARLWKANHMDVWRCVAELKDNEVHMTPTEDKISGTRHSIQSDASAKFFQFSPSPRSSLMPKH